MQNQENIDSRILGSWNKQSGARRLLPPYRLLFPLAALFALTVVPYWVLMHHAHPAVVSAGWHGHEMVFGFALAVIAGFLSTRPGHVTTWSLIGTWLGARIATAVGSGPLALIARLSFPVTVFLATVPPLLKSAKRRENLILPVLLAALLAVDVVWWTGAIVPSESLQINALLAAIDLLALLLLFFGGRALRAAAGGHLERQGIGRRDRMQRRYEFPLAALVGAAAVFDLLALNTVAGLLSVAAALMTIVRVIPWQLHRTLSQPQLWTLTLGYFWLVTGLALKGIAQTVGDLPVIDMAHGIGIGALGTLTLVMMGRNATLRANEPITHFRSAGIAALLISTAAVLRLSASFAPSARHELLWLAASAWSIAFLILLVRLWRINPPVRQTMSV